MYIYMVTPPPRQTPEVYFRSVQEGGGGKSTTPKFLEFPKIQKSKKTQPKFRIFGNSRNLLKIQKKPKFLEFPKIQKSKNPNPNFGFLEIRGICSKSKKPKILRVSKIPKIQNPNPNFGFLQTRGICSKPKKPKIPRVSKNPKIQKPQPQFRIFGNSRSLLKIQKNPKFPEFPKIRNWGWHFWIFGFLETRGILGFFGF